MKKVQRARVGQRVRLSARSPDAEAIDDVTFGWGIVGRLHEGARAVFERTKVNGEVWLPSRTSFTGTGRALLFRTFEVNSVTTYSDYKKFSVRDRRDCAREVAKTAAEPARERFSADLDVSRRRRIRPRCRRSPAAARPRVASPAGNAGSGARSGCCVRRASSSSAGSSVP